MSKKKAFLFIIISTTISSFFLLYVLWKRLNPILARYVNVEAKRFASNIINSSVNDIISDGLDEDLFKLSKTNGKIEILDYNVKAVNKLLSKINNSIHSKLTNLEDGYIKDLAISDNFKMEKITKKGIVCKVPMGSLQKNSLFINVGPSIPIRMSFIGQVESNLNTSIREYGINYLAIEVNVHVTVEEQIIMPATSRKETLSIEAPLTVKIIQGEIPDFYMSPIEKNSGINTLPIE